MEGALFTPPIGDFKMHSHGNWSPRCTEVACPLEMLIITHLITLHWDSILLFVFLFFFCVLTLSYVIKFGVFIALPRHIIQLLGWVPWDQVYGEHNSHFIMWFLIYGKHSTCNYNLSYFLIIVSFFGKKSSSSCVELVSTDSIAM